MDYLQQMQQMPRSHQFFIGFDSDGCVFDTMEVKQKECFCPAFIKHYDMQPASKYAREVWEFVNLYSKTRGCNRFIAIVNALKFLAERPEIAARNIRVEGTSDLEAWIAKESKLGNPALEAYLKDHRSEELERAMNWSCEVNARVKDLVHGCAPFPCVREVLEKGGKQADLIVVSQTPLEALVREWAENKIDQYVGLICAQEHGTKAEHIKYCAVGHYPSDHILMVGDAPGDYKAAKVNDALYFPIVPGSEEASWKELASEGLDRFFNGTFAGAYQQQLLDKFNASLPEKPTWK